MTDKLTTDLAHELWAIAQGRAPIEDVVERMRAAIEQYGASCAAAERERLNERTKRARAG